MNVLSLFDGISVARFALDLADIDVKNYYASEIEKNAIFISKKNYPNIVRFGSVVDLSANMIPEPIDLLIGGSPCQDLSIAKKDRKGLEGERSGLFWQYIRIMNEVKPKYFILENVASMPQKDKDIISGIMGCEPIMFNASLVSAQSRKRLFWTNIKFELPNDKGIILKDILQPSAEVDERMVNKDKKAYTLTSSYCKVSPSENQIKNSVERKQRTMVKVGHFGEIKKRNIGNPNNEQGGQAHRVYDNNGISPTLGSFPPNVLIKIGHIGNSDAQANRVYSADGKSCTLSANGGGLGAKTGLYLVDAVRKLTPIECERLQSLPDNYTEGIATTNRYKCLGNAFNAEVIAHILKGI
jgi:DNA (cytosine-5)-methyltransferase 3A